jgi:hypothetical protein
VCTVTFFSVPRCAVTVMPADGSASLAPFAGVIFTSDAIAAAFFLAWLALCPLPEQAAASSASAATAAMPAAPLSRLAAVPPLLCTVILPMPALTPASAPPERPVIHAKMTK